jgi:thiol-disulfide isomerase/thioredoxin
MKILGPILVLSLLSGTGRLVRAAESPTRGQRIASAATADEAYAHFRARLMQADMSGLPPGPAAGASEAEVRAWFEHRNAMLWDAGLSFIRKFPADPRRWDVVVTFVNLGFADGAEALPPIAGQDARRAELARLVATLRASSDASDSNRATLDVWYGDTPAQRALTKIWAEIAAKRAIDLGPLKAELARLAKAYPDDGEGTSTMLKAMVSVLQQSGASREKLLAEIGPYLSQANLKLRATAEALDRQFRLVGTSPQIAFTALDGRQVDLAKLRGKVVLIDCWATWCGPCKAELPNIKNVYAAYHDQGFEVIGATAEYVGLTPKDSPEQRERKIAAAKRKLAEFVAEEQLPWPQFFGEYAFKNPIYQQFGVTGIPVLVLIDQDGKVVDTDARGPKLVAEVKRLLKL